MVQNCILQYPGCSEWRSNLAAEVQVHSEFVSLSFGQIYGTYPAFYPLLCDACWFHSVLCSVEPTSRQKLLEALERQMPDSPNAPDMSNILIQRQPIPLTISGYQSMELEVNTVHVDRLTNAISILTLSKAFALCVTLVGCWWTVVASFGHLKCACDNHSLACNSKHSLVNLFFMLWALLFCWGTDTGAFLNSFHKQLWPSIMVGALVV